jgi:hypothetical protein
VDHCSCRNLIPYSSKPHLGVKVWGVAEAARITPCTVPATIRGTAAKLCMPNCCCNTRQSVKSVELQDNSKQTTYERLKVYSKHTKVLYG